MEALFSAYETILPKLQEHIFKQMGTDKFVAQKRAFDAARYLLPIGTQTNLGMRINARDLATLITKLLSSHVTEFQQLGVTLKAIAVEQLPTLVRHADANAFLSAMKEIAEDFAEEAARGSIEKESQNRCTIVECPHSHPAIMSVARAFLGHYGRHSDASFSTEAVNSKAMKLIDAVMDRRGEHDPFPDEFDVVPLTVEMVMDYGAYRDLQRHRYCTQFPQWPTIDLGYEIPEDITAVGLGDQYCEVMANAAVAVEMMQDRLEGAHPDIHLYMIPLAFRHRMLVQMSLKQAAYMIELRTRPQGHISYRRVAAELHDGLAVRMAPLAKWIRCNDVPRALDQ
jgi:thymidylate synthase ThyX